MREGFRVETELTKAEIELLHEVASATEPFYIPCRKDGTHETWAKFEILSSLAKRGLIFQGTNFDKRSFVFAVLK